VAAVTGGRLSRSWCGSPDTGLIALVRLDAPGSVRELVRLDAAGSSRWRGPRLGAAHRQLIRPPLQRGAGRAAVVGSPVLVRHLALRRRPCSRRP
jgi:hypothetical protein